MRSFGKWAIRIRGSKRSSKSRRQLFSASHFYSGWQTVSSVRWYTSPPSCRIFLETVLYFIRPQRQPLCWHSWFIWDITILPSIPVVKPSWQNRVWMPRRPVFSCPIWYLRVPPPERACHKYLQALIRRKGMDNPYTGQWSPNAAHNGQRSCWCKKPLIRRSVKAQRAFADHWARQQYGWVCKNNW